MKNLSEVNRIHENPNGGTNGAFSKTFKIMYSSRSSFSVLNFRSFPHLTCDLSQAEKKINVVES